ncbi:antA/AntB antirepressor family protein [Bartonella taylorii]|uniref:antA/AntB antirepressor family protein n=1 Tax=Bartonella taylorii TaxID=33046 RepID=UPI001ABB87C6|nr:antA/AntB antirepressor family protein [Bartonella taylorii]
MDNPITITNNTINEESVQTVNARELHAFLEVGKHFSTWINDRINKYNLVENQDFVCFPILGSKGRGGHNRKDYHLTLSVAKELSMLENNKKGKQARQYFIECERRAKQVVTPQIDYSSPQVMLGVLTHLKNENERKDIIIADLKPKAMALESLQRSDGLFGLTEAAKVLEMQPKQFILFLQKKGWVYRRTFGDRLLPYQDKIQKGLMDCPTITLQTANGIEKVIPCAKITAKGIGVLSQEIKKQSMH